MDKPLFPEKKMNSLNESWMTKEGEGGVCRRERGRDGGRGGRREREREGGMGGILNATLTCRPSYTQRDGVTEFRLSLSGPSVCARERGGERS